MVGKGMSSFAKKVYRVVLRIPLGEVRTYKWVAKKIGRPKAFRAVANILKKNPLPLIIPCHRVIRKNGSVGGYLWGKKFKERLLELEKALSEQIF